MGVVRAPSCGAGGKRRVRGCQGCQGGSGCPAGRPLLPFPPLLCNRALGSIKNSALQADCNAPSLGSTVWSGTERRRSVAFRLPQQRGPGEAGRGARGVPGPPEQHHAGLPKAVELRPCGQAQGSPGSCSVTGQGFSLRRCLSRLLPGPSPQAAFHWNKSKEKARLEGSEILHLAPEVALLYLYFFFFFPPPLFFLTRSFWEQRAAGSWLQPLSRAAVPAAQRWSFAAEPPDPPSHPATAFCSHRTQPRCCLAGQGHTGGPVCLAPSPGLVLVAVTPGPSGGCCDKSGGVCPSFISLR